MISEEESIIAFVFKRSGLSEISFSKFYLILSMDLNWFAPEEAKAFTNNAVKNKLLTKKDDLLKPTFVLEEIKVPVGFYPSKELFKEERQTKEITKTRDVLQDIIEEIVKKTKLDVETVNEKINQIVKEKNLSPEVVALLVGKEYNLDLDNFFNSVEEEIFQRK